MEKEHLSWGDGVQVEGNRIPVGCGMQNSRGQGREGGETGGREEDAGADSKIKEDEEEYRDGVREKSGRGEERTR